MQTHVDVYSRGRIAFNGHLKLGQHVARQCWICFLFMRASMLQIIYALLSGCGCLVRFLVLCPISVRYIVLLRWAVAVDSNLTFRVHLRMAAGLSLQTLLGVLGSAALVRALAGLEVPLVVESALAGGSDGSGVVGREALERSGVLADGVSNRLSVEDPSWRWAESQPL